VQNAQQRVDWRCRRCISGCAGAEFLDQGLREFAAESTEDPHIREIVQFMTVSAWKFRETADAWLGRLAEQVAGVPHGDGWIGIFAPGGVGDWSTIRRRR